MPARKRWRTTKQWGLQCEETWVSTVGFLAKMFLCTPEPGQESLRLPSSRDRLG